MELTKRKQNILASIVNGYIRTAEPVGSKAVSVLVGASPATVRNEMADLTELGLLEQPHTSAGRIPSARGYRAYVDTLHVPSALPDSERYALDAMLMKSSFDQERLLRGAAETLAASTKCLAIATSPSEAGARIRAVQFVQTSRRTAMLILLYGAGLMKNKVFHCDFDLSNEIMRIFFRVINERVTGKQTAELNRAFIQSLAVSMGDLALLMSPALAALLEVAQETQQTEVFLSGRMNLLHYPEYLPGDLRRVLDLAEEPESICRALMGKRNSTVIRIGPENEAEALKGSAVVASRYSINGRDAGAVAVIGPMRMDYARTASQTAYIAERVGELLTGIMREE